VTPPRITLRRGLDVALPGEPTQTIDEGPAVTSVAVLGDDHRLRRPAVLPCVGDHVREGERLVEDRSMPGVVLTSPAAGIVSEIEWGERHTLRSVVIAVDDTDAAEPAPLQRRDVSDLARDDIVRTLIDGGLWPALRTRPFHRAPPPTTSPRSIFVTATDSDPLAPRPDVVIGEYARDFVDGLTVLASLTEGRLYVCTEVGRDVPSSDDGQVSVVEFAGPHPAGLVGTHIHFLDPVVGGKVVWHVGYQDVIAIGRLAATGRAWMERVVALAGPSVKRPRLVRTRLGANIDDLVRDELEEGACRVISGSVLAGRQASGWGRHLGHFHRQICALPEPSPGSAPPDVTTALHGCRSPMIPTEDFERVMPLDLLPTPLLRALLIGDDERARELGCLELDEEDLALCTYVCPGKLDYGPFLTRAVERIEEGQ